VLCLAVLLFVSGLLVGVGLWKPAQDELALAREYRERMRVAVPALKTPAVAAPVPAPPKLTNQPVEQAATPAPSPAPAPAAPAATPPAPAPPAAPKTEAPETAAENAFVLQVGSFRDAKNAQQLQADLNGKGYQASVFNALDSEQRMWHVVRIGHYQDLAAAAQEAQKIGDKEQLQALIRRAGRL
jgi:cell division protein FtsN